MGSIGNIIARGIQPIPPIKSANEQEAERLGLSRVRQEQEQATLKAEMERRKLQQEQRDQQAVAKALESWDPKTGGIALLSRMVQLGASPGVAKAQAEAMAEVKSKWATASKAEQDMVKAQHEQARGLLHAITQAKDVASRQGLLEQALETGLFQPEQLTPEALPNTINSLKVGDWVATESLAKQREATLKAQQGAAEAAQTRAARPERQIPGVDVPFSPAVVAQKKELQPTKAEPAKIPGRDVPYSPEVLAQLKGLRAKPAAATGGSSDDIDTYAQAVISGKTGIPQVPQKIRGQVLKAIEASGAVVLSHSQRTAIGDMESAQGDIQQLATLAESLVQGSGPGARVGGLAQRAKAAVGLDPDAKALQDMNQAILSKLARGVGKERGNLSEGDVTRARSLTFGLGATREEIQKKTKELNEIIERAKRTTIEVAGRQFKPGAATPPTAAPPVETHKRRVYNPATGMLE